MYPNDVTPNSDLPPKLPDPFQSEIENPVYMGREYRFKFHGKAMEYFGIWIVNILLTIVTLSFYSPWAKVRRLRYFYSNTEFFDRLFDFTGIPTKILIGRLIAIGIWVLFAIASYLDLWIAAFGGIAIYIALPWLVRATVRFNARNTKFANSRFYFSGTTKEAYKQFLIAIVLIIFSLGLLTPVAFWLYKRYTLNHLFAGQLPFKLNAKWTSYMRAVYVPMIWFWLILFVGFWVGFFSNFNLPIMSILPFLIVGIYLFGLLFIGPIIQARLFIVTWNNTRLGDSQFKTECTQWRFAWIVATN